MTPLELAPLRRDDIPVVAHLLGVAYRDNPLMFALLGDDPDRRVTLGEQMHEIRLLAMTDSVVAIQDGEIVGAYGLERPTGPSMSPELQARMIAMLSSAGILSKLQEMLIAFTKHAPADPHWKLGPVGVATGLQGAGIGTQLVEHFCARVDGTGESASLDTDQPRNVRLYERFGFEVVGERPVLGVPMWFMARPAKRED